MVRVSFRGLLGLVLVLKVNIIELTDGIRSGVGLSDLYPRRKNYCDRVTWPLSGQHAKNDRENLKGLCHVSGVMSGEAAFTHCDYSAPSQIRTRSGVARVDQLPGHQVAFYKLNMKICRRDI